MNEAHARSTDPETSVEAAESVWNPSEVQAHIFTIIQDHGPLTDEEVAWRYGHEVIKQNWYLPTQQSMRSRLRNSYVPDRSNSAGCTGSRSTGDAHGNGGLPRD
jgi:hypothetical protein